MTEQPLFMKYQGREMETHYICKGKYTQVWIGGMSDSKYTLIMGNKSSATTEKGTKDKTLCLKRTH